MNNAALIRDKIVALLKTDKDFNGSLFALTDACVCASVDITTVEGETYRIAVVPHGIELQDK